MPGLAYVFGDTLELHAAQYLLQNAQTHLYDSQPDLPLTPTAPQLHKHDVFALVRAAAKLNPANTNALTTNPTVLHPFEEQVSSNTWPAPAFSRQALQALSTR